jgi:hypothetical protein
MVTTSARKNTTLRVEFDGRQPSLSILSRCFLRHYKVTGDSHDTMSLEQIIKYFKRVYRLKFRSKLEAQLHVLDMCKELGLEYRDNTPADDEDMIINPTLISVHGATSR